MEERIAVYRGRGEWVGLILILVLQAVMLRAYFVPAYYYGADENGYLVPAKSLARGGWGAKVTRGPLEFVGENMVQVGHSGEGGVFYAKYPVGYPALCAGAYLIGGPAGPFLVNPILAVLMTLGAFLLARELMPAGAALLVALLLATLPLVLYYGVRPMSHAADVCFATWAMFFVWRWQDRGEWGAAVAAGFFLAAAVSVRFTEVILVLPVVGLVGLRWVQARKEFGRLFLQAVGMAGAMFLGMAPLLLYLWHAFGSPWKTGYGMTGESGAFALWYFFDHLPHMLLVLNRPGFGVFLAFPVALVGMGFFWIYRRPVAMLLGLWALPCLILYTAYVGLQLGNDSLYARFFLSSYPALVIAAVALVARVLPRGRAFGAMGCAAVVVVALMNFTAGPANGFIDEFYSTASVSGIAGRGVVEAVPAGSVVVAGRYMCYYLDYAGDFELYYPHMFMHDWVDRFTVTPAMGTRELDPRRAGELRALMGGKSQGELDQLLADVLRARLAQGREVFLVCGDAELGKYAALLGPGFGYSKVKGTVVEWGVYKMARR